MKLLAIDAATEACSVALYLDGAILQRYEVAPRGHAMRLLAMVDELLHEAGIGLTALDAIAFDRGPGSFTGVRVGTSVTQGLAFGADLPVIPISSLAALAQGAWRVTGQTCVMSVIDARMAEVYCGLYRLDDAVMRLQGEEQVCKANAITPIGDPWYGAGSGWQAYQDELLRAATGQCLGIDGARLPRAEDILTLAKPLAEVREWVAAEQALPTYLRNEVASKQSGV